MDVAEVVPFCRARDDIDRGSWSLGERQADQGVTGWQVEPLAFPLAVLLHPTHGPDEGPPGSPPLPVAFMQALETCPATIRPVAGLFLAAAPGEPGVHGWIDQQRRFGVRE